MPHEPEIATPASELPLAIPGTRHVVDLTRQLAASTTAFDATEVIAPKLILRAMYFVVDASGIFARFVLMRLATVRAAPPVIGDFSAGNAILPQMGSASNGFAWSPMPAGSAVWTQLNLILPAGPNRIGMLFSNNNGVTVEVQLRMILDNPELRTR